MNGPGESAAPGDAAASLGRRSGRPLKVLLLSLFHPELVRGGAQQICYELFEGLKGESGVEPIFLAAIDPSFIRLYKSGACITGFDGRPNEYLFLSRDYDYIWHKNRSLRLIEAVMDLLRILRPDVVHLHHFLLFGIDIISVIRKSVPRAKIIFTFHEFMAICQADGHLVRTMDRSPCRRATPVRCHQCFPEHGPEHFFLRKLWIKRHLEQVDRFTTPSRFMVHFYDAWGIPSNRIMVVPNGQLNCGADVAAPAPELRSRRNRFGFFGQFVDNKGVHVLLDAVSRLRAEGFTDFSVELNGDNLRYASVARRAEFEAFLVEEAARPLGQRILTSNGSYQVDQLKSRMDKVDWCVVPSVWYEAFALVISEAWMFGRPVIASNLGAMAERVSHEKDGLLFNVGDSRALAEAIRRAATEEGLWERLVQGITPPPTRASMVEGYMDVYRDALADCGTP